MNKRLFVFVIILMGISLSGIILLQLFWISNAIDIREEHFDKTVNLALRETAGKLESHENIRYLSNRINEYGVPSVVADCDPDTNQMNPILIYRDSIVSTSYHYSIETDHDSDVVVEVWTEDHRVNPEIIEYKHEVHVDSLKNHVSHLRANVKLDTLSKIFTHNMVFVGRDTNDIVLKSDGGNFIIKKAQNLNDAFIKMAYEIESTPIPIQERIDAPVLINVLSEELFNKGIHANFEFGILSIDSLKTFPVISSGFDKDDIDNKYMVSLFPNELSEESNFLMLQFPGRNVHLLKSMAWTLAGSFLLTLIILITFTITIFMILRQKKLSDIKSDFINNMTHEFKTPIATISLALDSINNPKIISKEGEVRYYTGIIREENLRMNHQVENVLRMSLLDKHDLEFNFIDSDIHELINTAIGKVGLLLKERNGKINENLEAKNFIYSVDPDHFINTILNLLDNAIKYSEEDPLIEVRTKDEAKGLSITIKDHGIGMGRDVQHRIFDKFYRKSSGNIHNIKGFGLGLSYVKAIVDAFGGAIKVKSEHGQGSEFEIILPKK